MIVASKHPVLVRALRFTTPLGRLLWKEFRERRWWAACWAVVILAVSLGAHEQRFCGDVDALRAGWHYLPLAFAGVVGLTGYTSELQRGRALFLFTRIVTWPQLLLVKVLFGLAITLCIPLLAAILFSLTCPAPYRHFITLSTVFAGVWAVLWPTMVCYLVGLACSVVIPGLAGGALTVTGTAISLLLVLAGFECGLFGLFRLFTDHSLFTQTILRGSYDVYDLYALMGMCMVSCFLLSLIIGLIWGRFPHCAAACTSYTQRVRAFAGKILPLTMGACLLGLCLSAAVDKESFFRWEQQGSVQVSPGGTYALVPQQKRASFFGLHLDFVHGQIVEGWRTDVVRLQEGTSSQKIERTSLAGTLDGLYWVTDTIAADVRNKCIYHADTNTLIPTEIYRVGTPSPSERLAVKLVPASRNLNNNRSYLEFCNLENGRATRVTLPTGDGLTYFNVWWESENVVGYYGQVAEKGRSPQQHQVTKYREVVQSMQVPKF